MFEIAKTIEQIIYKNTADVSLYFNIVSVTSEITELILYSINIELMKNNKILIRIISGLLFFCVLRRLYIFSGNQFVELLKVVHTLRFQKIYLNWYSYLHS